MISVMILTYNRVAYIYDFAMSVSQQTYQDLELIIIDDGSTDETKQIVHKIQDSRCEYVYQAN